MLTTKRTYGRNRDLTPQHSDDDNEATTPPTSQHSVGITLTPKSKIAAMLADLDKDDSSEDDERGPVQLPATKSLAARQSSSSSTSTSRQKDLIGSADRPQSLPTVAEIMQQDDDDDANDADKHGVAQEDTAYDRIRKRLLEQRSNAGLGDDASMDSEHNVGPPTDSADDSDIELPSTTAAIQMAVSATPAKSKIQLLAESKRVLAEDDAATDKTSIPTSRPIVASDSDSEDIEAEMRMSSAKRAPRRAATKKAIEEMHRETERIARNMTLAPNAQVKTKLKINDFLAKIGYSKATEKTNVIQQSQPSTTPAAQDKDANDTTVDDPFTTPAQPSTPPMVQQPLPMSTVFAAELEESDSDIELPSTTEIITTQPAPSQARSSPPLIEQAQAIIHQDILLDSDSDLEPQLPDRLRPHKLLFKHRDFDKASKDHQIAKFVAMARPDSPTKQEARAEKARRNALLAQVSKQVRAERAAREAALKAAGVEIKSSEQRQKEAMEVEDLVEKARRQAEELRKLEQKEDRRKKAAEDGVNDESSEDDDDWQADAEYSGDDSEADSQSDEDAQDTDLDDENTAVAEEQQPVLARTSSILSERQLSDGEDLGSSLIRRAKTQKPSRRRVLGDDSEEDKENATPDAIAGSLASGLTQFFEPTQMEEDLAPAREFSATQILAGPARNASSDMQALRHFDHDEDRADSPFQLNPMAADIDRPDFVPSSQPEVEYNEPNYNATQFSLYDPPSPDASIRHLPTTLLTENTQATEIDNTQRQHDIPEIALLQEESLSRLRRGINTDVDGSVESVPTGPMNAFKRMRQAMDEEEHRKSRKAFVDDRAVESDDEYAGLGGASDEEPEDAEEVAAELADMIDHDVEDEDEEGQRETAAYHAQLDLEDDEKMVTNLMNDINNGGLRKKRGAGLLDMDDSEDEEEEKARYRARQAQMRSRLLESQNLTSLADNPKTRAFIEALEDKPVKSQFIEIAGEDDFFDFVPETQQTTETPLAGPTTLQHTDTMEDETQSQNGTQMAPPARPPKKAAKRKTLNEIRQDLSFLNDEENDSQKSIEYDPAFVPSLKRERSSMDIEDRSMLSRENSQTWHDPRSSLRSENSMYSQLASARNAENMASRDPVTVVVSKGHQMASRMATKAVNYHAKAAQQMREGREKKAASQQGRKHGAREAGSKSKRQEVLKLFA